MPKRGKRNQEWRSDVIATTWVAHTVRQITDDPQLAGVSISR
jgi:hypothetical protein